MNWREYNPQNDLNLYDDIGLNHNLLLEHFLQNVDRISLGSDQITIISDTINLILPKAFELLKESPDNHSKNLAYSACASAIIESNVRSNLFFQMSDFSEEFQKFWDRIKSNTSPFITEGVNDILNELKEIDKQITKSGLSDSEKILISRVNSIARYSSAYWASEKNDPRSEWIRVSIESGENLTRRPPDWVYVDISSAFIGALFTANPFAALGAAAVSSAFSALVDFP